MKAAIGGAPKFFVQGTRSPQRGKFLRTPKRISNITRVKSLAISPVARLARQ
jgi:hypothetical protein